MLDATHLVLSTNRLELALTAQYFDITIEKIIGGFNAKMSTAQDLINIKEHTCDSVNLDDVTKQVLITSLLENFSIIICSHSLFQSK